MRDPVIQLLKDAAELGDGGFNRRDIGVDRHATPAIKNAWAEIVSGDLVCTQFGGEKNTPLILTTKGRELIGLPPMQP